MRTVRVLGTVAIVAILVSLTGGQFALTVNGNRDYLVHVVDYSQTLAWVGSFVVEGTMGMALLAGLVIQYDGWTWQRAWIWTVLVLASAASVMGNMVDAMDRALPLSAVVTRGTWPLWVLLGETLAVIVIRYLWAVSTPAPVDSSLPKREPGLSFVDNPAPDQFAGDNVDVYVPMDSDTGPVPSTPGPVPPSNVLRLVQRAKSARTGKSTAPDDAKRAGLREWLMDEFDAGRWPTGKTGLGRAAQDAGVDLKTATRERDRLKAELDQAAREVSADPLKARLGLADPPTPPQNSNHDPVGSES